MRNEHATRMFVSTPERRDTCARPSLPWRGSRCRRWMTSPERTLERLAFCTVASMGTVHARNMHTAAAQATRLVAMLTGTVICVTVLMSEHIVSLQ